MFLHINTVTNTNPVTQMMSLTKIEPGMPNFERAHAFQAIKSALEPLPIDMLDAIGIQLNCGAIVDGLISIRRMPCLE